MISTRRLLFDTLLLGAVGAGAAQAFTALLRLSQNLFLVRLAGYGPPGLPHEGGVLQESIGPDGVWLVPVATTLGGLLSGLLVFTFAPEAEGHGTDAAVKAYHRNAGRLRARVAPLKMLASAITIGSGGAAGREGPTALIAAGFSSVYAGWMHRTDDERRLLVLVGMAAGLSAIFRSPIGTAVFAVEVLYREMEFEARALPYALLAAIVAYALNGLVVGWQPLFEVRPGTISMPTFPDHLWYVGLGLIAGLFGTLLPMAFYSIRDGFRALPLPAWSKPALGGLAVGLLALEWPQIVGGGYGWIQLAIDDQLPLRLLWALVLVKLCAFSLTVGSGGSGGVFAPSLFVGAMLGGGFAELVSQSPAPFVVVGMAAVFGAAARVPLATILMVTEMTGGYELLVPAALAVTLGYGVQSALSTRLRYKSLYEGQVPERANSPAHHAEHLRAALRILEDDPARLTEDVGHLDLIRLLRAGALMEFAPGKRLLLGKIVAGHRLAGKSVDHRTLLLGEFSGVDVVGILRGGRLLQPAPDRTLSAGDELLLAAPASTAKAVAAVFSSTVSDAEDSAL